MTFEEAITHPHRCEDGYFLFNEPNRPENDEYIARCPYCNSPETTDAVYHHHWYWIEFECGTEIAKMYKVILGTSYQTMQCRMSITDDVI